MPRVSRQTPPPAPSPDLAKADTRTRLLQAAMAEFIEAGYAGTDTNRIARRAGFAPQTFYRWFADKTAILIAVLDVWEAVDAAVIGALFEDLDTPPLQLAQACVENMRSLLLFKRNLRAVASGRADIRAAMAAARQRLLAQVAQWNPAQAPQVLATRLVQFEQLCEALAEGQFEDLGVGDAHAMAALAEAIEALRASPQQARRKKP